MLLETLEDGLEVHHLVSREDVASFREGFVAAYRHIFSGPPYEEDFTEAEAEAIYKRLTGTAGHITLIVQEPGGPVVAFAVAIPLIAGGQVANELAGLVPRRHTMYFVELGVESTMRGRRLGRLLVKLRLKLIDREQYSHVVLRVADGRTSSFEMYRSLQFTDMGVSMLVHQRRTDGEVRADRRHFMSRVLSQVAIED
jgi:ribosomal protein S18 acetylase RimI-like enzyme